MNDSGLLAGLVCFILFAVLGSYALSITQPRGQASPLEVQLFLWAFVLRFAMSIVIYQFGLVELLKDEDASGWLVGAAFHRTWVQQEVSLFDLPFVLANAFDIGDGRSRGYYYLLGAFFYLTDVPARLPAAALNGFFGALTTVFAYRIARSLFSHWVAVRVGWWTCLFPSMIIWSTQTIKEPVIIFLETLALYGCVKLKTSGFSPRYIVLCGLTILFLIPFRFYAAYIVGVAIVLTLLSPQFKKRQMTLVAALGVAGLVLAVVVSTGLLARHQALIERYNLQVLQHIRDYGARTTGSGVEMSYDLKSPTGFALATAIGAVHILLAPFPWQLSSGSQRMLLVVPELVVWWWLFLAGVLPGLRLTVRNRFGDIQALLLFIVGMGLLYSLIFSNVGLAYRQRAQLLPWLFIFAAVGLEQRALRQSSEMNLRLSDQVLAKVRW